MTRRVPLVATMLILAMVLLISPASADPIRITGGSMVAEGPGSTIGIVDIHGTQGFRAQLRLGLVSTTGPWQCCDIPPGTSIDMRGFFDASDGSGLVERNGISYRVPSVNADIFVRPIGGTVIAPPLSTGAVLTAPFELGGNGNPPSAVLLFDFEGEPTANFPLVGRGVATLELTPTTGAPYWEFVRARYDFEAATPVPEPATLLLLGTGAVAFAARRHRRRSRSPENAN